MGKLFYLFALVSLSAITAVRPELQCYVCSNCAKPKAAQVQTCGASSTTAVPAKATPTTPIPLTVTTSNPSTATPSAVSNSTNATSNINNATSSSNNTTSNSTSTVSNSTVTSNSPKTASNGTNTTSNSTNIATNIAANVTIAIATNNTNTASNSSSADANSTNAVAISNSKDPSNHCICDKDECECLMKRPSTYVTYLCYTHKHKVNGSEVVDRGCQAFPDESKAAPCSHLGVSEGCSYCATDTCNSALALKFSITLFICVLFLSFFKILTSIVICH